ncbi:hypothetical protein VKT23_017501 [Stygiomarasmius scandens]|uniref:Uncharacterized protein n=1 Tax=Marasmiellus scandens TaxID=2682957 RepID=A0ABR1IUZ2_9AGAR
MAPSSQTFMTLHNGTELRADAKACNRWCRGVVWPGGKVRLVMGARDWSLERTHADACV